MIINSIKEESNCVNKDEKFNLHGNLVIFMLE